MRLFFNFKKLTVQKLGRLEEHDRAVRASTSGRASRMREANSVVERKAECLMSYRELFSDEHYITTKKV